MSKGRVAAIARLRHMLEATDAIIAYTARGDIKAWEQAKTSP